MKTLTIIHISSLPGIPAGGMDMEASILPFNLNL
jgi:hypothetical protein